MFYTYIARNVENPQVENKQSLERKCLSDLIIQQSVFGGQFVLLKESVGEFDRLHLLMIIFAVNSVHITRQFCNSIDCLLFCKR